MRIERFEDIIAWQKSKNLSVSIYMNFKECRDYGFRDQICRAAVSIMNNIAEGYERQTNNELKQYLFIAKGSSGEVRSLLHLARELDYLPADAYTSLHDNAKEIVRMLSGFIKKLCAEFTLPIPINNNKSNYLTNLKTSGANYE